MPNTQESLEKLPRLGHIRVLVEEASVLVAIVPGIVLPLILYIATSPHKDIAGAGVLALSIFATVVALTLSEPHVRSFLVATSIGAITASPALPELATSAAWVPTMTAAFAGIVTTVFTLSVLSSMMWVGIFALIVATTVQDPASLSPGIESSAAFAGALLIVLVGSGLVLARFYWFRDLEKHTSELDLLIHSTVESKRDMQSRVSVMAYRRRVHETILNTLSAVILSNDKADGTLLADRVQSDLVSLSATEDFPTDSSVRGLISHCLSLVDFGEISVTTTVTGDAPLGLWRAAGIRDAVVEALRNAIRHAGAQNIHISAAVGENITLTVTDDGHGIPEGSEERFGTRVALREGVRALGGETTLSSNSTGTTVTIVIPTQHIIAAPVYPLHKLFRGNWLVRLGLIGTPIYLALITPFVSTGWPQSSLINECAMVVGLTAILLCIPALDRYLWFTLGGQLVALSAGALLARDAAMDASHVGNLTWFLYGLGGGCAFLAVMMVSKRLWLIVILVIMGSAPFVVAFAAPMTTMGILTAVAVVDLSYVLVLAIGMMWILNSFDSSSDRIQLSWSSLLDAQYANQRATHQFIQRELIDEKSMELLVEISTNRAVVLDPVTQARSAQAIGMIRSRLDGFDHSTLPSTQFVEMVVASAGTLSSKLTISYSAPSNRVESWPVESLELTQNIIEKSRPRHMSLVFLSDEGNDEFVLRATQCESVSLASEPIRHSSMGSELLIQQLSNSELVISLRSLDKSAHSNTETSG